MELVALLGESEVDGASENPEVRGVANDSRRVSAGDVFVAMSGGKSDGNLHVAEAVSAGAVAVVSSLPRHAGIEVPWVRSPHPRRALGRIAARLAGDPASRLVLAGVTGTNGKTTTSTLLSAILARRHGGAGLIGTVGHRTGSREIPARHTTPEAPELQALLAEMVANGLSAAAMEVSSHALELERVEGCRFDLAVFTNLTRDHLDFHGTFERYYEAKKRLFALRKEGGPAVLNLADPWGDRLAREVGGPIVTYSASGAADVEAAEVRCDLEGIAMRVVTPSPSFSLESPLIGRFNVENLLAATAGALALGISPQEIASAVRSVHSVPGRMERVEAGQPYTIVVDYAHTEDALRRLLLAVRDLTDRQVILVFGCGGDRDAGKRFPMGEVAGRLADIPIVTSDNPRSEDPEAIISQVEEGIVSSGATKYLKLADRREAIRAAIELANPRTVVVIAGKGHETIQVIGGRELPFDDRAVAAGLARSR
ncbi:MAG: UDP-N-acetylmuramoyl-L-alanyl-D-glutamate--2,6-diaminopimelate ligase [Thermoanaerobaculia bacterium]